MLRQDPLTHACHRQYPGGTVGRRRSPSPTAAAFTVIRRLGFRVTRFEACSAFTQVMAYMLARSPMATLQTRGFDCFVSSTAAPIATGWSDSCRAGISPAEVLRLSTAHE